MAALGWLLNLDFAGGAGYVPPAPTPAGGFNKVNFREAIHLKPREKPAEGS